MATETQHGTVEVRWPADYRLVLPDASPPATGFPLLVALHGYGDDAARLADRLEGLAGAPFATLVPDAPFPVVIGSGDARRIGRSWYHYTGDQDGFAAGLSFAAEHVDAIVDHAAAAYPLDRRRPCFLGYSQGGYLAGAAVLREPERFAGLVAISCRVKIEVPGARLDALHGMPILVLHGERDESVALGPQREACAVLETAGARVDLHVHSGGHGLRRTLVPRIREFATAALAPRSENPR